MLIALHVWYAMPTQHFSYVFFVVNCKLYPLRISEKICISPINHRFYFIAIAICFVIDYNERQRTDVFRYKRYISSILIKVNIKVQKCFALHAAFKYIKMFYKIIPAYDRYIMKNHLSEYNVT